MVTRIPNRVQSFVSIRLYEMMASNEKMVSKVILFSEIQYLKKYEFKPLDKNYKIFTEREFKDYLIKWNMDKNFKIFPYSFQGSYEDENRDQLFTGDTLNSCRASSPLVRSVEGEERWEQVNPQGVRPQN
ncbi:uncharacterized protein C11orf70 [Trichonephila clavipes]|nr:uncharacterized protein C11orf70 [Trichonephila clavipes]